MCMTPFQLKHNGDIIGVPCGKCPKCIKRRASAWSFRLMQEDKISETSYFITLTYDTETVPITNNGFMSLYRDCSSSQLASENGAGLTTFWKRVRKAHSRNGRSNIKYYCVGEYGTRWKRPHYHGIVFNVDLKLMVDNVDLLALEATDYDGKKQVKIKQWPHGFASVGKVSGASIGYCLKYMSKKRTIPMHRNDDRIPEFSVMSKGLGKCYLTDQVKMWHYSDLSRMFVPLEDGKVASMPRYIKDKLYDEFQRAMAGKIALARLVKRRNYHIEQFSSSEAYDDYIHSSIIHQHELMWADAQKNRNYE